MKKNIAILTTKLSNGGAERASSILAERLLKKYNVYLIVFDNSIQDYETKANLIDLRTHITKNFVKKIFNFFKRIYLLKKIKKEYKIDCTISLLTGPNIVNILSKKKDKVIISIRNNIKEKGKLENIINKFAIKKADKIVTVSEDMRKFYIENDNIPKNKIFSIYNTCNLDKINEASKEEIDKYKEIFEDKKIIISLGRFIKQKGQWHLIKAFSKIIEEHKDYKLVIFGRGEEKEYLQKLIDGLKLNENVFLLSFVNNPYKYLKSSEIYVCSSLYEGCSNSILEAMAIGLPIIATDCDYGNREILCSNNEKYGILVPVGSNKYCEIEDDLTNEEIELYKAIKILIEDKDLREFYSKKSLERIRDFKDNTNKWVECIEKVV